MDLEIMSRYAHLRRLGLAALSALGLVLACRSMVPGEAPPLAPRPGPVEPSANPVPGAPDPIDPGRPGPTFPTPDAQPGSPTPKPEPVTMREVPSPDYRAAATPAQARLDGGADAASGVDALVDAGNDATTLSPVSDAMPTDAAKTLQP